MYVSKRFIIIPIYFLLINLFGVFLNYLEYVDYFFCNDCKDVDSSDAVFDYIVVGCGSAGSIVARRLAENKKLKILVLEAGRYGNTLLDIPSMGLLLQKTAYDWQHETVPQSTSCLALDRNVSHWPMGKIVGGTSMLHNMIYVRGHQEDFDEWFTDKEDYDFTRDILPYFVRLENKSEGDQTKTSVYTRDLIFTSLLPDIILRAAKSLGFYISNNTKDETKGFGLPKINAHKGQRWTTAHRLLSLNMPNVVLHTNRYVHEVLFHDNFEAYGVKYSYMDKIFTAKASKGVIISAGVIGSPKLLLLSGIGPKQHLDELGIPCKTNLPVGENLQDHLTTGFDLILLNQTLNIGIDRMVLPSSIFEYFWNGKGPWTTTGCEVLGYINTKNTSTRPDLQFMVMPLGINEDNGIHLRRLIGISDYTWNNYFALLNQTATMTVLPILLHPRSKGTVRLKDKDFRIAPSIDPKYLSDPEDVEMLIKGIDFIKKLVRTDAMQEIGARFNENLFPGCEHLEFDSRRYWECYLRHLTVTSYHPVGTCKMGAEGDPTSVVDFDFQVKNTNNLFIVDGSVMPTLSSGNINAPVLMLAEMASDLIKYKLYSRKERCNAMEIFITKDYC